MTYQIANSLLQIFGQGIIDPNKAGIPTVDANSAFIGILNTVYFVAGIASIIVIIVAGLIYSLSAGDSGKIKQAREAIIYGVVGLIVVLSAAAITWFVIGSFS